MMAATIVSARTDEQVKKQASEILGNLGLDMSGAINIFLRAIIRERGIPFAIVEEPDEEYKALIKKTISERLERSKDPNTKYYSSAEMLEMLGL